MAWLAVGLVALAVSLDGMAVGGAYGLRGTRIPWGSLALIGLTSNLMALLALIAGRGLALWLSPAWSGRLGAAILLGLGCWYLVHAREHRGEVAAAAEPARCAPTGADERLLLLLRLRPVGLVIQVLRDPHAADVDRSGRLEGGEAVLLGFSLALDAAAAGVGLAQSWQGVLFALLVGPVQAAMFDLGGRAARRLGRVAESRVMKMVPGSILVVIGLLRLL